MLSLEQVWKRENCTIVVLMAHVLVPASLRQRLENCESMAPSQSVHELSRGAITQSFGPTCLELLTCGAPFPLDFNAEGTRAVASQKRRWTLLLIIACIIASPKVVVARQASATTEHVVRTVPQTGSPSAAGDAIRQVDFLSFSYPSGCSERDRGLGFPPVITVVKGKWGQEQTRENHISYSVSMPIYGHLLGRSAEQAVIAADCFLGNGDDEEVFVYGISGGAPKLIQRLSFLDWAPDRDVFDMTGVAIRSNCLVVTYTAGGSHAQPAWSVSRTVLWTGSRFVPGSATRKPYRP